MVKTATRALELDAIDRLEEKLKLVVGIVERLRSDQAKAVAENERLSREIERLNGQIASNDGLSTELNSLREERDIIRTRVTDMLEQLESLNL
jgi:regulator of replication initiation timing